MRTPLLRRTLAGGALALAPALIAAPATAQVVYSGVLNRTVNGSTGNGVNGSYVQNVVTGSFFSAFSTPGASVSLFPTCPNAGCNWDFAIISASNAPLGWSFQTPSATNNSGSTPPELLPSQVGYVGSAGFVNALAVGTLIGTTSSFVPGGPASAANANTGFGTGGIFGFRFRNETGGANTTHYGWARVILPTIGNGVIVDYAFNATAGASIAAGDIGATAVVPEPSTYALLAAGLAGVGAVARRRRGTAA